MSATAKGTNRTSLTLPGINPNGPIDAALLLNRTGTVLAVWTRKAAPIEVLSVMSATIIGSIGVLVEALGDPNPRVISVETESLRISITRVDESAVLVLIAPSVMGLSRMRRESERILRGIQRQEGARRSERPASSDTPSRSSSKARVRRR